MLIHDIQLDEKEIKAFCRRHRIARLSLFGSILREDFGPQSDADFLVEFQPDRAVSLFDLGGMNMELREFLQRDVDIRTPQDLSGYFRDEIVKSARLLYDA